MFKKELRSLFFIVFVQFNATTLLAFNLEDEIYYTHQGESKVLVRSSLDSEKETLFHLNDGDILTLLDEKFDQEGELWFRVGREVKSSLYIENAEGVDLWIREDRFANLNIVEEILARVTYCYRYVKKYLLKKGFVDTYLPGASAYMAATILPKHGFSKVERKPQQAIKYDVCVYRGGPSGHGHIEVLDPQGWYYGYGYKKQPIKNRTFTGCFHKKLR
jgi:hypothetical protein